MIPMDDFELESKIIKNSVDWISKSALFRKVGGNRNRLFSKVDDLIRNGTLDGYHDDHKILVKQNLVNSDDPTWYSVYDWIEEQFEESADTLYEFNGKHLFKGKKIQPKLRKTFDTFCFNVDTIMQHIIKLEYAKLFSLVPLIIAETRQKRFQALLKKQISKVESSLKNESDRTQFKDFIQKIDRTWNIHV